MVLGEAVRAARDLRDALAAEVDSARGERSLFRTLDAPALLDRAQARAGFQARVARLEDRLRAALAEAGRQLGLAEVTIASLASREPAGAAALSRTFGEVRALSSALAELDRLNQHLAARALRVVRGYVDALSPTPSAYDRRGQRAAAASGAVHSSRV
jgi:hypothetical protein